MLLNEYINKLDYDEEMLVNEACDELDAKFDTLPVYCESVDEYHLFSEGVATGFIEWVKKIIEAVKKFFADVFASISEAFEKKDIRDNIAKFKKLSAEDQKACLKALKEKKLTQLDVDKFEKAVGAIKADLEKAYTKYETMKFKDSDARDAYVDAAMETAMKKLKVLDDYMDAKMEIPIDQNSILREAEAGVKVTSKKFEEMISDITDSMEKIGKKETTDSEKDVDKTSGRKSFVLAFKNLGRTVRTGFAKHGKEIIAVALALAAIMKVGGAVVDYKKHNGTERVYDPSTPSKPIDTTNFKNVETKTVPVYNPNKEANDSAAKNLLKTAKGGKTTTISGESENKKGVLDTVKGFVKNYNTKRSAKKNLGKDVEDVYFVDKK